ncbi:MAG: hypothetical protein LUI87_03500 [Lachnospiraceae bacterium]|nr:hypothetical protein [Lachnospiraceae bacterium]
MMLINKIKSQLRYLRNQCTGKYPEKKISRDKKEKETYYIIRRNGDSGFFSNYLYVLGHINYARRKGYFPVVDMKNYPTVYNECEPVNGTMNSWEYYFYQPEKSSLEKAYVANNVILSSCLYPSEYTVQYVGKKQLLTADKIAELNKVIAENILIRQEIVEKFDYQWKEMNKSLDGKNLGVHIRGTDMNYCKGHPRPKKVECFIDEINKIMQMSYYKNIFLCTDEQAITDRFNEEYGSHVFFCDSYRAEKGDIVGVHLAKGCPRDQHRYKLGLEVLRDAYYLSKCDSLICGDSNVPLAAMLFNNNQYEKVIKL